jgi:hypothetical protein
MRREKGVAEANDPPAVTSAALRRGRVLDVELALALLFVLVLNLPYLYERIVPIHDTFYNFASFHIFYGEFFFHRDLARWYPYGTFGLPSDFEQAASLSPASYAVGLAGALLGVRDVLLLFKLGAIVELLAFVFSVHLLGRRLFPSRATTLVLCLAAAGSVVWSGQQWWDFRLYYLLPLVLYFFATFLESERPHHLWFAGITCVAWALGLPPYATPLLGLVVLVVVLVAMGRDTPRFLSQLASPSRSNLLALGAFLALAASYAYFVTHALDHTSLHAPGRDALTGKVDPETFRTYGGNANLMVVANAFLFGWPLQLPWGNGADNSVYIGLVPLLGFGVALARERSRMFIGLTAAIVVLVLLSFGGAFTRAAYYLPGFAYYRHVGLVYGLVKVLILLASGYGLERLWSFGPPRLSRPVLIVVGGALLVEAWLALPKLVEPWTWVRSGGSHLLVRLVVYGTLIAASRVVGLPLRRALGVGLVLDLALFQLAIHALRVPELAPRDRRLLAAVQVRELSYQPVRRESPALAPSGSHHAESDASRLAFELTTHQQRVGPGVKEVYWYIYQFAHFDPCQSQFRTDYLLEGVDRLLRMQRERGFDLGEFLGCGAPKLRLVSRVLFADSPEEAERSLSAALRTGGEPTTVVWCPAGSAPPPVVSPDGDRPGHLEATRFTLGELSAEVRVDAPEGAWLVYADGYHPGWLASVNGRRTTVCEANLAFKAIPVPPGATTVRFWFRHGANTALSSVIAVFGAVSGLGLLAWLCAALLRVPSGRGHPR